MGKTVRKICRFVKEGQRWRMRINKEIKDILQREDIVKFMKFLRLDGVIMLKD
jgi:hypothetical protein